MSANTILMIYLLRKHIKLSTFRSQSAKISCPQIGMFGNLRKYHVREKFLSYSNHTLSMKPNRLPPTPLRCSSSVFQHPINLLQLYLWGHLWFPIFICRVISDFANLTISRSLIKRGAFTLFSHVLIYFEILSLVKTDRVFVSVLADACTLCTQRSWIFSSEFLYTQLRFQQNKNVLT